MLKRGDWVQVRSPDEIASTLDQNGTVDRLPFMPEMIDMCGVRFRVASHVLKTCFYGGRSTMLAFRGDDVVTLERERCSGADHDGCQKQCLIFWRERWLRPVTQGAAPPAPAQTDAPAKDRLRRRLKTMSGPDKYFCQASELLEVADRLSSKDRFLVSLKDVAVGNCSALEMARRIGTWLYWRVRRRLRGEFARGIQKPTPIGSLSLRPGERIGVKPMRRIIETLDHTARNRGLHFTPDMARSCNRAQTVEARLEKIIVDGSGEMREVCNTVYLDGSYCGCSHVAFGGCPRQEFSYWREIWLERSETG